MTLRMGSMTPQSSFLVEADPLGKTCPLRRVVGTEDDWPGSAAEGVVWSRGLDRRTKGH